MTERIFSNPQIVLTLLSVSKTDPAPQLPTVTKVRYNNPGLIVDLGVGLWAQPLPWTTTATAITTS